MNKYLLEIAVFLSGAIVMIFELVGSRVLAPYMGTSIFVWTSLIGVILGSLSLGYWLGGKASDRNASYKVLSAIFLASAILIFLTVLTKDYILSFLKTSEIEIASFTASVMLFAPASALLGMVSPYAVRLKIRNLEHSGSTVGNLYAISTIGSILGTFSAGFFLIPTLGSTRILIILALALSIIALIIYPRYLTKTKILTALFLSLLLISAAFFDYQLARFGIIDIETRYSRVLIYEGTDQKTGRKTRNMSFEPFGIQSAIFLEGNDDLVFDYTKFYRLARHFRPDLDYALSLGGAGYTYPRDYLEKYPDARLDVVEIDEKLTELAKKYFRLKEDPRLAIYHEDARTFLNRTANKYDVIFGDAFQSLNSIPYQLTTKEATERIHDILDDRGVAIINIISAIDGEQGRFLRAEYATYKSVFPQVYLFPVKNTDPFVAQNIILVALKSPLKPGFSSPDPELDAYLKHLWAGEIELDMPVLTDDFAPVDHYVRKTVS